jgi:hypothetical protein
MIRSLGRRLSLFFHRAPPPGALPEGGHPGAAVLYPMVDFVAFAEDCTLFGRIRLRAERLTDMLNDHEEVELVDVMVQSLTDPSVIEIKEVIVPRHELLLVSATGPRGDLNRRTRTRQTSVAVAIGPYTVRGNLHTVPFVDAMSALHRRSAMVPLTDAVLDYQMGGDWHRQRLGALIVNRVSIDHIIEAVEHDGPVGVAPATDDADHAPDFGATILAASGRASS